MRELTLSEMEFVAGAEAPKGPTDVIGAMADGATAGAALGGAIGLVSGGPAGAGSGMLIGGAVGAVAGGVASIYEYYNPPQGEVSVEFGKDGNSYTEPSGSNY